MGCAGRVETGDSGGTSVPRASAVVSRELPRSEPGESSPPGSSGAPEPFEPADPPPEGRWIEGRLTQTKGAQALLDGHLIDREALATHLGDDWMRWFGEWVRVLGVVRVHHCAPDEQCLTRGSIPYFEVIHVFEVPSGSECPTAFREGARCGTEQSYCVLAMGEPCGHSERLVCEGARWVLEREENEC